MPTVGWQRYLFASLTFSVDVDREGTDAGLSYFFDKVKWGVFSTNIYDHFLRNRAWIFRVVLF